MPALPGAAPLLAAAGLGPALVPANLVPPRFDGRTLLPDPPVRRALAAYIRPHADPLSTAFLDAVGRDALLMPVHARHQHRHSGGGGAAPRR